MPDKQPGLSYARAKLIEYKTMENFANGKLLTSVVFTETDVERYQQLQTHIKVLEQHIREVSAYETGQTHRR